ncbi:MAG: response regulator transcription factor [Vicinamibacterales bacterium]
MVAARTRILVVDDELEIAQLVKHALEREGDFVVEIATTGTAALESVASAMPSLLILDLNLPSIDGTEVCRILRARPATARLPIIMLTARTSEPDRVFGLDLGADDYIPKPFGLRELAARVRAILRRRGEEARRFTSVYRGAHLTADFEAVIVTVDDQPIRLTRREFDLLRCLVDNRNRVLSRDRLLDRVWGYDPSVETRSVDVHVGRLRAKLGTAGRHIETVIGLGYRFAE